MDHIAEKEVCLRQTTCVEASGRCECQFAEVDLAMFQVEVRADEGEWFGENLCTAEELVHAIGLGHCETLRGSLAHFVETLEVPVAVKEIEFRTRSLGSAVAAEDIFRDTIEAIDLVVGRGKAIISVDELFAEEDFRDVVL